MEQMTQIPPKSGSREPRGKPEVVTYHPGCIGRPAHEMGTMHQRSRRRAAEKTSPNRPQDGKCGGTRAAYRLQDRTSIGRSATDRRATKTGKTSTASRQDTSQSIGNEEEGCRSGCKRSEYNAEQHRPSGSKHNGDVREGTSHSGLNEVARGMIHKVETRSRRGGTDY